MFTALKLSQMKLLDAPFIAQLYHAIWKPAWHSNWGFVPWKRFQFQQALSFPLTVSTEDQMNGVQFYSTEAQLNECNLSTFNGTEDQLNGV